MHSNTEAEVSRVIDSRFSTDSGGGSAVFSVRLASMLTGATPSQLRSWRAKEILVPEVSRERPPLYSFRDLVALRTIAFLRASTSSQKVAKAFTNIGALYSVDVFDLADHPSQYRFGTDGRTIFAETPDGKAVDLVNSPGSETLFTFSEIMDEFKDFNGRQVVDFRRPSEHVEVDVRRMGGWPSVLGTRVPYDVIASLVDDKTVTVDDVSEYYPRVSRDAVLDVLDFDQRVKAIRIA